MKKYTLLRIVLVAAIALAGLLIAPPVRAVDCWDNVCVYCDVDCSGPSYTVVNNDTVARIVYLDSWQVQDGQTYDFVTYRYETVSPGSHEYFYDWGTNICGEVTRYARGRVGGSQVGYMHETDCCCALAVTVADFHTVPDYHAVEVLWETASEVDNLGFNIWRGTTNVFTDSVKINESLIPSQCPGGMCAGSYSYVDAGASEGSPYFYWLQAVDNEGGSEFFGPEPGEWNNPDAVSLSPTSGSRYYGYWRTFVVSVSDEDSDLNFVYLMLNDSATLGGMPIRYTRGTNKLHCYNGVAWVGGYAPGSANTITISNGVLSCEDSSVSGDGSGMTASFRVKGASAFVGTHNSYIKGNDSEGNSSGWVAKGTWEWTSSP